MIGQLDLGGLGLDRGGHLLVKRALRALPVGASLEVTGTDPHLALHLRTWARAQGHEVAGLTLTRGAAESGRWRGAERAGGLDQVEDKPDARWGLAARGARVEAGGPEFDFPLADKDEVWTEDAARLYAQAAANQWDPETAIDWAAPFLLPEEVEDAVVQVMTYLIENETAALIVPARFLARIHPHFREILQLLAIQVADEARHIEVFTRRARLRRPALGLSTVGGQASLKTLLDEPDFALASFLLSVLGEGSFLDLLRFLMVHAPDPVTRQVARLTSQDEARHVAFGVAHLARHAKQDPGLTARLAASVHRRHQALQHTAGLNEEVFDALLLLSAGSWEPADLARGWERVSQLKADMDRGRRLRLSRLGFSEEEAATLSSLHVRNFM
ncbi:MAG: ferritin-like domain-containing protein [Alphaproteobacteria bacterium]|nr:ferritin-like domain-containing protein [Alphaproteobacteria bacterium]MCB9792042.1 ferritin-like domain-containing protein [Alphaproteobacteria bacterium]